MKGREQEAVEVLGALSDLPEDDPIIQNEFLAVKDTVLEMVRPWRFGSLLFCNKHTRAPSDCRVQWFSYVHVQSITRIALGSARISWVSMCNCDVAGSSVACSSAEESMDDSSALSGIATSYLP